MKKMGRTSTTGWSLDHKPASSPVTNCHPNLKVMNALQTTFHLNVPNVC